MSLKELTADKHRAAEDTAFMKAVIDGTISKNLWADFTYQKQLIYNVIEGMAGSKGLLNDLPDIRRAHYLYMDYQEMNVPDIKFRQTAIDYHNYILSLTDQDKILAHLYVWHMGDLFGGQMIKKIVKQPHRALDFKDPGTLMTNLRAKIDDRLGDEANVAFDWAIKIMESYDRNLGSDDSSQ
jgi:heme oxygenase